MKKRTLLLTILLSACTSPQPTGKIAFSSDRDGKAEIYLINADGTGLERLTYGSSSDTSPVWSPDGRYMAFNREFEGNLDVCVVHADGSPAINLTAWPGAEGSPSWSPDGTHIAFASDRDGNLEIYTMAGDGTDPVNLTKNPAADATPSWSPDGERIAFASDRHGSLDIYILHLDSGTVDRLTTGAGAEIGPAWSPDAGRIGFSSDGDHELYLMNADGTGLVRLTDNLAEDKQPSKSPVLQSTVREWHETQDRGDYEGALEQPTLRFGHPSELHTPYGRRSNWRSLSTAIDDAAPTRNAHTIQGMAISRGNSPAPEKTYTRATSR